MRTHRHRSLFDCWTDPEVLSRVVRVETLAVARLEPVIRQMHAAAGLDLTFIDGDEIVVLPMLNIEASMLAEREKSPFVWPYRIACAIGEERAAQIERDVLPWIESLALSSQCNDERIRFFNDDDSVRSLFESAREARFLGAATYREVALDCAPYAFAIRFAESKRVWIDDEFGATGAAMLSRQARAVRATLRSPQRERLASRWFGRAVYGPEGIAADVAIVGPGGESDAPVRISTTVREGEERIAVATPLPYDVLVSFDLDDAPEISAFSVRCDAPVALRTPMSAFPAPAAGGSAGTIVIALRESWQRSPDGDVDDALELAERLRAEGFTTRVACGATAPDALEGADLLHVFGMTNAAEFLDTLRAAKQRRIPVVATAGLEDVCRVSVYGSGLANLVFKSGTDEATLDEYCELLAERRLETEGFHPRGQEPFSGYREAVREALGLVDVLLVSGAAEEAFAREQFAYSGPIGVVSPYLNTDRAVESIETLVGDREFIFAHAPLEARGNQLLLLRAASLAGLPVAFAGPVVDVDHYMMLREIAGENVVFVPRATPAQLEALYRRARVFADVSWFATSLHRPAKAALSGAALVTSAQRYCGALWRPGLWEVDASSVRSIASGLRDAWTSFAERPQAIRECASRVAAGCDPVAAFVATVQAYAQAQEAVLKCASA